MQEGEVKDAKMSSFSSDFPLFYFMNYLIMSLRRTRTKTKELPSTLYN